METFETIVRDVIAGSPYARKLAIACEQVAPDQVRMRLPWTADHVTIGDLVHGGAIASLVDVAATGACWATPELAPGARGTTIGFSISYLNAGRAQDLLAAARIVQRGRSIVIAEVDVHGADGTHVARALVTYKRSA
ncbi:MAG: PaaI family thioesterase [Deltaproteobacteria bacterium]|nr:PaaI family thioesterase [Deltaproteobacteria bacterium]